MNFDEAKKALIEGYGQFGFKYGFQTQTEDETGVYLSRGMKYIITKEDIQSFADFQNEKSAFESLPLSCGICSINYREHILVTTDPYPFSSSIPPYQTVGVGDVTFGTSNKNRIYAEIGLLSKDFWNFFRLDQNFHYSSIMPSFRPYRGPPMGIPPQVPPEKVFANNIKDAYYKPTTIKVYNLSETDISKAFKKSSKIIEDCLFQLSYLKGVALWPLTEWPRKKFGPTISRNFQFGEIYKGLNLPLAASFNSEVIRFYLLGITSKVPELKFLAFYQVLEYFFVSVSNEKLYNNLSNLLKDPNFYAVRNTTWSISSSRQQT